MIPVKFHARNAAALEALPAPRPASKALPAYFKPIPRQTEASPQSGTVKRCVPFLDAMTAGFILPLWCDLWVTAKDGNINFEYPPAWQFGPLLDAHPITQIPGHPLADAPYGNMPLKFLNPWTVETPPGYSALFTAPRNHLETRFHILDGIVDTDTYYNEVNFPFVWTGGDGEFFIPAGTPLVQVIPFKREEYDLELGTRDEAKSAAVVATLGTKMRDSYRSLFWHNRNAKETDQ